MNRPLKKNYQVIKDMNLDELAEHHTLFLQNFWKFIELKANTSALQAFIKDWLLEDVKEYEHK